MKNIYLILTLFCISFTCKAQQNVIDKSKIDSFSLDGNVGSNDNSLVEHLIKENRIKSKVLLDNHEYKVAALRNIIDTIKGKIKLQVYEKDNTREIRIIRL